MFLFDMLKNKSSLPKQEDALKRRDQSMTVPEKHYVKNVPLTAPFPEGFEKIVLGLGCFWGAERAFWQMDGVYVTAVGFSAGFTKNPTYREVCSGQTGHNEVVLVVYDPEKTTVQQIIGKFFESHNPTQGMRQGNDVGTQYRSGIYWFSQEQYNIAKKMKKDYQHLLDAKGFDVITTEIQKAGPFYYAEEEHQQYLAKNPGGYCGLGGIGVACPVGVTKL